VHASKLLDEDRYVLEALPGVAGDQRVRRSNPTPR
jgi:hypothetical protein